MEAGVALGVSILKDLVLKDILLKLGEEALKDYVKDFFKDCIKEGVQLAQPSVLKKAIGEALQQFLKLVQDELMEFDLSGAEIRDCYEIPISQFIRDKEVKPLLGQAFEKNCHSIDGKKLEAIWQQHHFPNMPDGFDWDLVAKQYVRKVKGIIKASPELRDVFMVETLEVIEAKIQGIEKKIEGIAGIVPEFDLRRYQEGIRERYGNLNLQSLDTSGYAYNELKLWRMFIAQNVREIHEVLPQIHELPKEHLRRLRESNHIEAELLPEELERYKQGYVEQPIRPVLDIINNPQTYKYVVILGDPGSGKSTLLQFLALNWANSPLDNVIFNPIPLLIELRTYVRNQDDGHCRNFLEFFHQSPGSICHLNQHQLDELLKAGKAFVMFDGLDEVFDTGKREDVITCIHRFTNDYPNVRVIVTSRVIGYNPKRLRDAQFHHFMLQDLEPEQIKNFIYRWHNLTFNDEVDKVRKRERLQKAIDTSKAIGELAGNPLLLTMMAILNRNQDLPRDRPTLYEQASRVLLHQWDVERALVEHQQLEIQTIDYKDKQAMLRQVAYHMQAAEKGLAGNLISASDLERILTGYLKSIEISQARTVARLLIEQLRSRNFILCFLGADSYGFVHRTFLEYFCACEFVERFGKRGLEGGLTLEELKTEVFGKHWWDESWHEVLRLIAGMIDTSFAGQIIDYLIEQNGESKKSSNLLLAAECLLEVRNRQLIAATANKLLGYLKSITTAEELQTKTSNSGIPKKKIVLAIATIWKDDPDTLPWLKSCIQSLNEGLHWTVVETIARGWKDDPDTLPWLKTCVQLEDKSIALPQAAVREIAEGWKDNLDTLPWLKTCAQFDDSWLVRYTALHMLAQGWKDDPETLAILKTHALSDDDPAVRGAAVEELARGWKDDPETLPILKTRALSDNHRYARVSALEELARGWKDEPWMFEFLCDRALNDPFERKEELENNPRQLALEIIIKQYCDHPQTLPLLQDRAENDPDEKVREFAKKKLEQIERPN